MNGVQNNKSADNPLTLGSMLLESAYRHKDHPAILQKVGTQYQPITYHQLYLEAASLARGFYALGLRTGDRLGLLSENRPEWIYVDYACQLLGIINVPVYPNLPATQVQYLLQDSSVKALVTSDRGQLHKLLEVWETLPSLHCAITIEGGNTRDELGKAAKSEFFQSHLILTLNELRTRGCQADLTDKQLHNICLSVQPGDLATIIYTSGTTGEPKGAMLTHRNIVSNVEGCRATIPISEKDVFLSCLPLNHVFERTTGYYFPIRQGSAIAYAESALRVRQNLMETQPTVMIAVPRILDGLKEGLKKAIAATPEKKRRLIQSAVDIGARRSLAMEQGKRISAADGAAWITANKLVLKKLREMAGLSRIRYMVSGSAPLPAETNRFLRSLGITVLEGYGLTETSPVVCVNIPAKIKIGSVGPAFMQQELSIADDGEILCRGPNIMLGYLNKPRETQEAIDENGWFHTGDVGRIDEDGYLFITDRKKDLIVLSTGKKVAPQPIESKLRRSEFIKEVVVLGDMMSACVALIIPDFENLATHGTKEGWPALSPEQLCAYPAAIKLIKAEVDRHSTDLAEFERIRSIALIAQEFTVERGELTPTMKVRRPIVMKEYANIVHALGKS